MNDYNSITKDNITVIERKNDWRHIKYITEEVQNQQYLNMGYDKT